MITVEVADPPSICVPAPASCHSWAGTLDKWSSAFKRHLGDALVGSEPRPALAVTGATVANGYLCVQYEVTPVPDALQGRDTWCDGPAGTAFDNLGVALRDCQCIYRQSDDGSRVIGMVIAGPITQLASSSVCVSFLPTAANAKAIDQSLCELDLQVGRVGVELISIRWA